MVVGKNVIEKSFKKVIENVIQKSDFSSFWFQVSGEVREEAQM